MNDFVNDVLETFSALFYFIRAGLAAVSSNAVLLVGTIIILLSAGKSFKLGKLLEFKSK